MNIFVLSADPYEAAHDHVDRHVVKMPIEYSQLLATSHRLLDGKVGVINHPRKGLIGYNYVLDKSEAEAPILPLASHNNHPVAIWARESSANYEWLYQLYLGTGEEYTRRYGKNHASMRHADRLQYFPENIPSGGMTPFRMAMPEEFSYDDAVQSYRRYIKFGKRSDLHRWKDRDPPRWFTELE